MILFMTNCMNDRLLVDKLRKRSAAAARNPMLRTLYNGEALKKLPIPTFINEYNHKMNNIDRADYLRVLYRISRKIFKT